MLSHLKTHVIKVFEIIAGPAEREKGEDSEKEDMCIPLTHSL
jgi:hypothetical protein